MPLPVGRYRVSLGTEGWARALKACMQGSLATAECNPTLNPPNRPGVPDNGAGCNVIEGIDAMVTCMTRIKRTMN